MSETSGDTMTRPTFDSLPDSAWTDDAGAEGTSPVPDDPQTPDTATASPPDPAITGSAPEPTPGEAPLPNGPIPLDRHKAILEGERKKYTDLDSKWQRVAWADELISAGKTPEQVREALQVYDGFSGDPTSVLERLYAGLVNNPTYAPQVKSWAGRMLAGGRNPIEAVNPQADPEPTPDFQNEQGIPFFSGPQMAKWQTWRERQLEAKFAERLGPLERARQQAEEAAATERVKAQVTDQVSAQLKDMRAKPHFTEYEADIKAYLAERGYNASLESAYIHVLTTKVLPGLSASERAKTVTELKTQAAASSAKPTSAASATPIRPKDFNDPGLVW